MAHCPRGGVFVRLVPVRLLRCALVPWREVRIESRKVEDSNLRLVLYREFRIIL
jgi:hypothetical protein